MSQTKSAQVSIDPFDDPSSSSERSSAHTPVNPTEERGLWKEIRKYPKVAAFCVGLNCAALIVGYDLVIVGQISALPSFR